LSGEGASYRRILKSTSIMGGATFAGILIGLAKMKVFALLLGSMGVGLFGTYGALLALATVVFGMGLNSSGVRELSERADDPADMDRARLSLWLLTWALAFIGAALVWVLRAPIESLMSEAGGHLNAAPWIALGVVLTLLQATQLVVLQSFGKVTALARVSLMGALLSALVGVALIAFLGRDGILPALVAVPAAGLLLATVQARQVPAVRTGLPAPAKVLSYWRALLGLGAIFVLTAAMHRAIEFGIRAYIVEEEGLPAAGLFQAAVTISGNNVGLVLAALAADYFPRLSAVNRDPEAANELVNQQIRTMLLITGPLLLLLVAGAPFVLQLLYSREFVGASGLLQLQAAGDGFKVVGWALGFVMVVKRDSLRYLLIEAGLGSVFVALSLLFAHGMGIEAYGLAWILAHLTHTALLLLVCSRRHHVTVDRSNLGWLAFHTVAALLIFAISTVSPAAAITFGGAAAFGLGVVNVRRLAALSDAIQHPFVQDLAARLRRA